jgi:hypothetical protein
VPPQLFLHCACLERHPQVAAATLIHVESMTVQVWPQRTSAYVPGGAARVRNRTCRRIHKIETLDRNCDDVPDVYQERRRRDVPVPRPSCNCHVSALDPPCRRRSLDSDPTKPSSEHPVSRRRCTHDGKFSGRVSAGIPRTDQDMMWPLPNDGSFPYGPREPHRAEGPELRLTYQVAEALLADDRTRRQRITVEVQNRVVLLTGVVDCQQTREAAITVTRAVPDVRDVCDGLRMRVAGAPFEPGTSAITGLSVADAFDEIVAGLDADEPSPERPVGEERQLGGILLVLLAAVGCLLVGVLILVALG